MDRKEREKKISEEQKRLEKLFQSVPENKRKLCERLIQNAAFMATALEDLQRDVVEHGSVIETMGGNGYAMIKDNPAQKAYTTMIARYAAVLKQLTDMMPGTTAADSSKLSALMDDD